MKNLKKEGFWKSEEEPDFATSTHSKIKFNDKLSILSKLKRLEKLINERKVIKSQVKAYKGSSI